MKPGMVIAIVFVLVWMLLIGYFIERHDQRLEAIERALATKAPAAAIAAPAALPPASDRARYERLYQATRDASAAAAYITERARAADRAHVPTPRSSSR